MARRTQDIPLDGETIDMLRTVCAAGRVRSAFNGEANARLEELLTAGLLAVVDAPSADAKSIKPQRSYKPTQSGRELSEELEKGVA